MDSRGTNIFPRRGFLIALSGVDGSGKTTQIDLLEDKLRGTEPHLLRIWSRWRPISSLPLLTVLLRKGYAQVHSTSSIGFVETRIPRNGGVAFLWCLLTQVDNFMKTALKIIVPLFLGYTIICDRYVLDMLVEGMADLGDPSTSSRLGYQLLRLLPRPNVAFLIDVTAELAFNRKPDLPTLGHFTERVRLYQELYRTVGVRILDGEQTPQEIHGEIWRQVSRSLRSTGGVYN